MYRCLRITLITMMFLVHFSESFTEKELDSFHNMKENGKYPSDRMKRSPGKPNDIEKGVDKIMEKLEECRRYPGLVAAVISPKIGVWTKGYGKRNYLATRRSRRINENTNFQIHELTRSFTAVVVVNALEDFNNDNNETYTFDTKIKDILGAGYELPNEYLTDEVTIKDLLASRVGFAEQDFLTGLSSYGTGQNNVTREEMCKNLNNATGNKPFRDGYNYNHYSWMMLGHIAEKLSGRSWEDLVMNDILLPAGMSNARIWKTHKDVFRRNSVVPLWVSAETNMEYQSTTDYYQNGRFPFEPSVGLILSASDMAIWLHILMNEGKAPNGQEIVNSYLFDGDMYKPTNYLPTPVLHRVRPFYKVSEDKTAMAGPFVQGNYRGFAFESLEGVPYFGTSAMMMMFRDIKVGIFVATSGPGKSLYDLYEKVLYPVLLHLADVAIGLPPFYTESNICSFPFYNDPRDDINKILNEAEDRQQRSVDEATLENARISNNIDGAYGFYNNPLYGTIEIANTNDPTITVWFISSSSFGSVDFGTVLPDSQPASFFWYRPLEYQRSYYLPNVEFKNSVNGTYQTLTLGGITYTRSNMVALDESPLGASTETVRENMADMKKSITHMAATKVLEARN